MRLAFGIFAVVAGECEPGEYDTLGDGEAVEKTISPGETCTLSLQNLSDAQMYEANIPRVFA